MGLEYAVSAEGGDRMGRKEDPMLYYYKQDRHFAELLNGWLFRGETRIQPEQVRTANVRYTGRTGKKGRRLYRTRYRDIVKHVESMKFRVIIGTEIQTYIDYAMPVRVVDYDIMDYREQIEFIRQKYKDKHPERMNLSGLEKTDRLLPVFTLVLYLGEEPWDAGENLRYLLELSDIPKELLRLLPDYPIHVLDVCHTPDDRLLEFPDDIACMFLLLKYQKNKVQLKEILDRVEAFRHMDNDTYDTICDYMQEPELLERKSRIENKETGGPDMWQALREIREEEMEKGMEKGESRLSQLLTRLLDEGRSADLERAVRDKEYRRKLIQEYSFGEKA